VLQKPLGILFQNFSHVCADDFVKVKLMTTVAKMCVKKCDLRWHLKVTAQSVELGEITANDQSTGFECTVLVHIRFCLFPYFTGKCFS